LSKLWPELVVAICLFVSVALRFLIAGERFDRALHGVDTTYKNLREIAKGFAVDPIAASRDMPRAYGRYYGIVFRPVGDAAVEEIRRRAVRAFVDVFILGFGGVILAFILGALLRQVSTNLHTLAAISAVALLLLFWSIRLVMHFRDPERSSIVALYMLAGIATAGAGLLFLTGFLT
jgi:hypothetical protein